MRVSNPYEIFDHQTILYGRENCKGNKKSTETRTIIGDVKTALNFQPSSIEEF